MIIDCSKCEMFESDHCKDCLVTAILDREDGPVEIDPEEQEAITNLQGAGLAPVIKFKRKAG